MSTAALAAPGASPDGDAVAVAQQTLSAKSKSFALAAKLLPRAVRGDVAVVYAYCRHVDDAIDLAPVDDRPRALRRLREELDSVYDGGSAVDVVLDAFRVVVRRHGIPRAYADELLSGMEMDVLRQRYETRRDLSLYCFRVAGTVGLMMCHVLGLRDARALRHAVHLGLAMQLSNICRDVAEDLADGRLYLPRELLRDGGLASPTADEPLSAESREPATRAVRALLADADRYYRSADRGLFDLPFRAALAVRVARLVYSDIGNRLRARGCDPFQGRVVVPTWRKAWLVAVALASALAELPRRAVTPFHPAPLPVVRFPDDVG